MQMVRSRPGRNLFIAVDVCSDGEIDWPAVSWRFARTIEGVAISQHGSCGCTTSSSGGSRMRNGSAPFVETCDFVLGSAGFRAVRKIDGWQTLASR